MSQPSIQELGSAPLSCPHDVAHDTQLVSIHDASCCLHEPSRLERAALTMTSIGVLSCVMTVITLAACLPLKLLWIPVALFVALIALAARPTRRSGAWAIAPSEIADGELRATYCALLAAHNELAHAVVDHGRSPFTRALLDQSRDVLVACGRIAHTTNPGARYLAAHSTDSVTSQAAQAHAGAHGAGDPDVSEQWGAADTARQRQLLTMQDLRIRRDRVHTELGAAVARLEVTTAEVLKLHMLDAVAVARTAGSGAEHGAALHETLDGWLSVQAALPPA